MYSTLFCLVPLQVRTGTVEQRDGNGYFTTKLPNSYPSQASTLGLAISSLMKSKFPAMKFNFVHVDGWQNSPGIGD